MKHISLTAPLPSLFDRWYFNPSIFYKQPVPPSTFLLEAVTTQIYHYLIYLDSHYPLYLNSYQNFSPCIPILKSQWDKHDHEKNLEFLRILYERLYHILPHIPDFTYVTQKLSMEHLKPEEYPTFWIPPHIDTWSSPDIVDYGAQFLATKPLSIAQIFRDYTYSGYYRQDPPSKPEIALAVLRKLEHNWKNPLEDRKHLLYKTYFPTK